MKLMPVRHMDFDGALAAVDLVKVTLYSARDQLDDLEKDRDQFRDRVDELELLVTTLRQEEALERGEEVVPTNPLVKTPEPIEKSITKPANMEQRVRQPRMVPDDTQPPDELTTEKTLTKP